jgi:uncharacterized protein YkwD
VNVERAKVGAGALREHSALRAAAQYHSDKMASTGNFSHDGWAEEIRNAGYGGGFIGQNIAGGQVRAASVMAAWMSSPTHKANIVNPNYRELGVGCARRGPTGNGVYWTQDFGG